MLKAKKTQGGRKGRTKADAKDLERIRRKLEMCIEPLDPDNHPSTIVNIVNGQIAAEYVYVGETANVLTQAMKQYESKWSEGFNGKISNIVEPMAEQKGV